MIHLVPNSAENIVYVTPFEARKFLPPFTGYLMTLINQATGEERGLILKYSVDNERYTKANIPTDGSVQPAGGGARITESGLWTYKIEGIAVTENVGVCEVGTCKVSDEAPWTIPNVTIPDNVIYYE
jgi:hypothetical protein